MFCFSCWQGYNKKKSASGVTISDFVPSQRKTLGGTALPFKLQKDIISFCHQFWMWLWSSWWFQPLLKNISQNWIISQGKVENKNFLKPPPTCDSFVAKKHDNSRFFWMAATGWFLDGSPPDSKTCCWGGYTLGIIPPFNMPRKHAKTNHPNKTEAAQSSAKFEKKNIWCVSPKHPERWGSFFP